MNILHIPIDSITALVSRFVGMAIQPVYDFVRGHLRSGKSDGYFDHEWDFCATMAAGCVSGLVVPATLRAIHFGKRVDPQGSNKDGIV
jgi:hypothetical protein